jgi:hypothetical protein
MSFRRGLRRRRLREGSRPSFSMGRSSRGSRRRGGRRRGCRSGPGLIPRRCFHSSVVGAGRLSPAPRGCSGGGCAGQLGEAQHPADAVERNVLGAVPQPHPALPQPQAGMHRQSCREPAGRAHAGGQPGAGQELSLMEGGPRTPPHFPHGQRLGVSPEGPASELATAPWLIRPSSPASTEVRVEPALSGQHGR